MRMHRGEFAIEVRDDNSDCHFEQVDGYVLEHYGVARKYHSRVYWAVTHLGTGLAVKSWITQLRVAKKLAMKMEQEFPTDEDEKLRMVDAQARVREIIREVTGKA